MADRYAAVALTAAVTGGDVFASQSPHILIGPKAIAEEAVQIAQAGASRVHARARATHRRAHPSAEMVAEVVAANHRRCDVVVSVTTGGGSEHDRG